MAISTPPRVRKQTARLEPPLPDRPSVFRTESSLLELTVLVVVIAVVAAMVGFVVVRSFGAPTYQATIENVMAYTSNEVMVDFQVRNLGDAPATPSCVVDVSSSASAVTGEGAMTMLRPIPARSWATYHVVVPVSDGGAMRVGMAASSVACH